MLKRLFSRFSFLLIASALVLGWAGCDSGVPPGTEGDDATTVQFASSGAAVTIADETASIDITISNPDGQSASVEVLFAQASSTADATDLGLPESDENAIVVETVSFPASAEDGDTQSVTFDIGGDEPIEDRLTARFALQNLETGGSATIGTPREFELSIGFPTIREVRTSNNLGDDVTVQGTVTRIDDGTAFMQDDSGGIAVFDDTFSGGVSPGDLVIVSGELDVFAGLLEIVNVGSEGFTVVSSDNEVSATTTTLAELEENGEDFEATLVRVEGMSFEDSGTFQSETNYTVSDGSGGGVQLRVPAGSFYVGEPIPSGEVTFEGVLSQFNGAFDSIEPNTGYQMLALQEGDIMGGDDGGGGPQVMSIEEARGTVGSGQVVTVEGTVTRNLGENTQIQDETAGITISRRSDIVDAVNDGDRLRVTSTVTEFNGLLQLDQDNVESFEVISMGNPLPEPAEISLDQVSDFQSELVRISGLEIVNTTDDTFQGGGSGGNYDVTDGETTITLRVESGSFYEGEPIPDGTFTFRGITGAFNGPQIQPINEGDIITDGNGGEPDVVTINEARDQGEGATVTIEGTVTRAFGDFVRLQDESGPTGASGLVIRQTEGSFFDDVQDGTITQGTQVQVSGTLSAFNGLLQINEDDLSNYNVQAQGSLPEPQTPSLTDLADNGEDYESELIQVDNLTIVDTEDETFQNGTSYTVEDGDGNTLTFRVQNDSETEVGGEPIPEGAFTFEGVLGEFSGDYQLIPVRTDDIQTE